MLYDDTLGPEVILLVGVVAATLLATAWAMLELTPPKFWIARGCIGLATLVLGATSFIGFSETLGWVNTQESSVAAQTSAAVDKRAAIRTQARTAPTRNRDPISSNREPLRGSVDYEPTRIKQFYDVASIIYSPQTMEMRAVWRVEK